ncbi:MAG: acetylglutamate kinase [Chitinophagaceae bacterium]
MQKLFVIKIGGNVIDDPVALESFMYDFALINEKKILVHGGGKIASSIAEKMGIPSRHINGRRITDEDTIDIVTMVYGGLVNKKIVSALQRNNCNAIGLTGADANIIKGTKRPLKEIDYGFVGDIESAGVSVSTINLLLENNLVPVVAPLTHNGEGQMLNTNADTIASVLSVALSKDYEVRLLYCFEKKGVLLDVNDEGSAIQFLDKQAYKEMGELKLLFEGILPKIDNAFAAIEAGVKEVLIGHANDLLANTGKDIVGTLMK